MKVDRIASQNPSVDPVVGVSGAPLTRPVLDHHDVRPLAADDRITDGAFLGRGACVAPDEASIEPFEPTGGRPSDGLVYFVNGIMTDAALHALDAQALADTGASVIGIRNATAGLAADLAQCAADKANLPGNPATDTVERVTQRALEAGEDIHLVGHSQGALIICAALGRVRATLADAGLNDPEIEAMLGSVRVETYGGAGQYWPDGPQYVHYVNDADLVPKASGVESVGHPGRGAVIVRFQQKNPIWDTSLPLPVFEIFARNVDRMVHGPRDIYFGRRVSFEAAASMGSPEGAQ